MKKKNSWFLSMNKIKRGPIDKQVFGLMSLMPLTGLKANQFFFLVSIEFDFIENYDFK